MERRDDPQQSGTAFPRDPEARPANTGGCRGAGGVWSRERGPASRNGQGSAPTKPRWVSRLQGGRQGRSAERPGGRPGIPGEAERHGPEPFPRRLGAAGGGWGLRAWVRAPLGEALPLRCNRTEVDAREPPRRPTCPVPARTGTCGWGARADRDEAGGSGVARTRRGDAGSGREGAKEKVRPGAREVWRGAAPAARRASGAADERA